MALWARSSILLTVPMDLKQLQVPVIVVCIISALVATFAIVCRVWARALMRRKWEANDWLILVAYVWPHILRTM